MRKIISSPCLFPLFTAIYPILAVYYVNVQLLKTSEVIRSLIVVLIAFGIFLLGSRLILKNWMRSGFLTFFSAVLFFSYGHVYNLIDQLPLGRHLFMLPFWGMLFLLGVLAIWKKEKQLKKLIPYLNLITAFLVVFQFLGIVFYDIKSAPNKLASSESTTDVLSSSEILESPDIYYIILDGYACSNTLQNNYGYDNSDFIDYLTNNGFYVAKDSKSNYSQTFLSLASSLNMEYLEKLPEQVGIDSLDRNVPYEMIQNSRLTNFLRSEGYTIINFSSGWGPTNNNPYADENYDGAKNSVKFNEFEWTLLQTTLLNPLSSHIAGNDQRDRIFSNFKMLEAMPASTGPKFVFAHILSPHPPYLFDQDGNSVNQNTFKLQGDDIWSHKNAYLDQLIFINKMVEKMVDQILSQSSNPPIIILQADHGSASSGGWEHAYETLSGGGIDQATQSLITERNCIFNAYHFPGNIESELYLTISPVNSFRIVLNTYFGENLDLLKDESYFSDYDHPYHFFNVTQ